MSAYTCLDWLGRLSRNLLSERVKLLILRKGTCVAYPFARPVSERGHGHPDGFRYFELKTERFGMAYRLSWPYAFVRPKSEQNSSHREVALSDKAREPRPSLHESLAVTDSRDDFYLQVDAQRGAQTKAPRQQGRSQIASSQIFRRRAWSAGPPGFC